MEKQLKIIDSLIDEYFPATDKFEAIYDGVLDYKAYCGSAYKVLWVLKEPHDEFDEGEPSGGGWSLEEGFRKDGPIKMRIHKIMAMLSYCFEKEIDDVEIAYTQYDKNVFPSFIRKASYINIKKYPGYTSTDNNEISDYYSKTKPLFLRQLFTLNPDIIIFGVNYVFRQSIVKDLGLVEAERKQIGNAGYYYLGRKLIIDTSHPSFFAKSDKKYIQEIIDIFNKWKSDLDNNDY